MVDTLIKIDGLDAAIKKLERLGKMDFLGAVLLAAAEHVKGVVDVYPKDTIANSPANPKGRWYERGYGPRWRTADGKISGRKTSEMLGRKWTTRKVSNLTAVVGNRVSYAPQVMDRRYQSPWHKKHGWITIQQTAEDEADTVVKFISDAIRKELAKPT